MGLYENIDVDFVARTAKIIEQYSEAERGLENYEVTLLVNCLVGLLILPQQKRFDDIPEIPIDRLLEWHIESSFIEDWGTYRNGRGSRRTLKEFVRHLRNGVAHFHIDAEGTSTNIERLTFSDENGFKATIPVKNLKGFVLEFAKSMTGNQVVG